jgi:hypothetical protein
MELKLKEYCVSLTEAGYRINSAKLLIRFLNNFLLLRSPFDPRWSVPLTRLNGVEPATYWERINGDLHYLGVQAPTLTNILEPDTSAFPKTASLQLIFTVASSALTPPFGYSWFWYCPWSRYPDCELLGFILEQLFEVVRTSTDIDYSGASCPLPDNPKLEVFEAPSSLWLWKEGGDGTYQRY